MHRDVTQQAQDLGAEEGAIPDLEELVEEALRAGEPHLGEGRQTETYASHERLTAA